jgi:hypothetical protein
MQPQDVKMIVFDRRISERRSHKTLWKDDRRNNADQRTSEHRRKYERHKLKDIVFVETKDSTLKMGRVSDISKGGLAFSYIDIGVRPQKNV